MKKLFSFIIGLSGKQFIFLVIIISLLKCSFTYILLEVFFAPGRMVGYLPDSYIYEQIAKNIISGHGFSFGASVPFAPTMFKEPLYAFFIALIYFAGGPFVKYIIISQVLLNPLIAVLIYLIGREIFDEAIARLASVLAAIIAIFAEISLFVQAEAFYLPLLLLFLYILVKAFKDDRISFYFFSGALLGACALCRNIMFYFPSVFIILIASGYGKGLKFNIGKNIRARIFKIIVFMAAFGLIVSPWIARNLMIFKSYQISERGGRIMWAQAAMAQDFSGKELKAYFLYLISGHLAQKMFPDVIGSDFGNFEYRYFDNAPAERLRSLGLSAGQIDIVLAKSAVKKMFSHPFKFIVFSAISYLQIFKYFTPWSVAMLEPGGNKFFSLLFPAIRFLFGFPMGIIYTSITVLGIYYAREKLIIFLPVLLLIVYYHFILFFLSGVPGSTLQRFVLPAVPLYSFFAGIFILKLKDTIK